MDNLKEHPQIVELLDTLDKNGLMKEKNESCKQKSIDEIKKVPQILRG